MEVIAPSRKAMVENRALNSAGARALPASSCLHSVLKPSSEPSSTKMTTEKPTCCFRDNSSVGVSLVCVTMLFQLMQKVTARPLCAALTHLRHQAAPRLHQDQKRRHADSDTHHEDGHVLVLGHQEGDGALGDGLLDLSSLLHDLCMHKPRTCQHDSGGAKKEVQVGCIRQHRGGLPVQRVEAACTRRAASETVITESSL